MPRSCRLKRRVQKPRLQQAQVELDKTVVRAGVAGSVQQFTLRAGDVVNPMLRPAGILVPAEAGRVALIAGFGQIEADVLKVGMIGEAHLRRETLRRYSRWS